MKLREWAKKITGKATEMLGGRRYIVEQFGSHEMTKEKADEITRNIFRELSLDEENFEDAELIFEGRIYQDDKIGTRIYRVHVDGQERTLKIQFLKPHMEEVELIAGFQGSIQAGSRIISPNTTYDHKPYSDEDGYGYTLMEKIKGEPLFEGGKLPSDEQMEDLLDFYIDLQKNWSRDEIFEPNWYEKSGRAVTAIGLRLLNWNRNAIKQGRRNIENVSLSTRHLVGMVMGGVRDLQFTHGNVTGQEILKTEEDEFAVFSYGLLKYLPPYYEATYPFWAIFKDLRGAEIPTAQGAIVFAEKWKQIIKEKLNIVEGSEEGVYFEKYWAANMRERALGALIMDIDNDFANGKMTEQEQENLKTLFKGLFTFYYG